MLDWLTYPWVSICGAPLLASALTIFIKWSSQNDRHAVFKKEDCAIGQELAVVAVFALVAAAPSLVKKAAAAAMPPASATLAVFQALGILVGLWIISTIVRKAGWKNAQELRWWIGLIIPLLFGLGSLFYVTWWLGTKL